MDDLWFVRSASAAEWARFRGQPGGGTVKRRFSSWTAVALVAIAASLVLAAGSGAAIGPPWCGTVIPDGVGAYPDGTGATDPVGSYPHIPWYAISCTLEDIQSRQLGNRMTFEVTGQSALGRDMYGVVINALDTETQRKDFKRWKKLRKIELTNPAKAQRRLAHWGDDFKIPLFIQAGIHGNEPEGIDADLMLIERLVTTPYGVDPEVDNILNHSIVIFNVIQNPDGHIANQRANGNNFDLNRDFLTQSQPETKNTVKRIQKWLSPELLDQHGYVTPTLIEATTKPHNPGIDYDFWLKWNQSRIDANEAAMNAAGYAVTRPINDWCPDAGPPPPSGICAGGIIPGPAVAEGWDDWGPFYTPMYSQLVGLNGSTVEMCNQANNANCGVPGTTIPYLRGRIGSRTIQDIVARSTLAFDIANREELTHDQLEIYRRGVNGAPRPPCCDPPFDVANNWMHEFPEAYVIPLGKGQRSNAEANRLVEWLFFNGIRVWKLEKDAWFDGTKFERGSYVVWMEQAHRGLADTALGIGVDVSDEIGVLYAPPAAWSHGYLWGADVFTIPNGEHFRARTDEIYRPNRLHGGAEKVKHSNDRLALELDSATAVRTLNGLLADGIAAQFATAQFTSSGKTYPAGTIIFARDKATSKALDEAGEDNGLTFVKVSASSLPALEPVATPKIAVLTGAVNQDVWSLRNLGFAADPISTATINTAVTDPLVGYDVIFNTGAYPAASNVTGRARLTSFFASGGGYIGVGVNGGANFLTVGGQLVGMTAASRSGNGRSGIVYWNNEGGPSSPIVGAYPSQDTMIVDPPTWFTATDALTVDARLPATDFFAAGLWLLDAQSATAPGAALIAHGNNIAGTARLAVFANNPLYRADPEREWPFLGSAIYWADQ
jgi:Zinc carboxypeptidase